MELTNENIDVSQFKQRACFMNNTGQTALGAGFKDGYEPFLECWCMLRSAGGSRALSSYQIILENSWYLITRYYNELECSLKSNTRVKIGKNTYTIDSYNKVEESDFFYSFTLKSIDK